MYLNLFIRGFEIIRCKMSGRGSPSIKTLTFPPILIQMKDMWQVTNLTHHPPTTHIHSTHIRKSRETKPTLKNPAFAVEPNNPNCDEKFLACFELNTFDA